MGRKRAPQYDFICIRCGCPCDPAGDKHLGGGQNMRACQWAPNVRLRSGWEAEIAADAVAVPRILRLDARQPASG